jgi:hypothetical protein
VIDEPRLALFVMLGQTASASVQQAPQLVPRDSLRLSSSLDLAGMMPEAVRRSSDAAECYRLFFVFENYLREFVSGALIQKDPLTWWDNVPDDVREGVAKMEETEEAKSWMALGSREKTALMTYPQLLRVIEHCWKSHFEDLLRDRMLVQQARLIGHLRNTICHMSNISSEELERVRQTMRDWFRRIPP